MTKLHGIVPPIITPVLENEDIDEGSLRNIVNRCVETGIHGIFVAGSGGETMALTQRERNKAIQIVVQETRNRIPVLCGVMDTSTRKVIENIKQMEQLGGEYAVVTPVFYTKTTDQNDIVKHVGEISRNTNSKIVIYNIPPATGNNVLPETVSKLLQIDKVVGLKDSGGNLTQFQKILFSFKETPELCLFQGVTEHAGISFLSGADGCVPIFGVFFPKVFVKMYESGKNGDIQRTMFYQQISNYISDTFTVKGNNIIGAKSIAGAFGCGSPKLCNPSVPLAPEEYKRLQQLALLFDSVIQGIEKVDLNTGMKRLFAFDDQAANF